MSAIRSLSFGLLLAVSVLTSCSACPRGEHIPRLSEVEVLTIANDAARRAGTDLSKFNVPQAYFEYVDNNCTWSVLYEGIGDTIGNHFLVIVDDNTRQAQLFGGS